MATGNTITGSVADSLDDVRSAARIIREYEGELYLIPLEKDWRNAS